MKAVLLVIVKWTDQHCAKWRHKYQAVYPCMRKFNY